MKHRHMPGLAAASIYWLEAAGFRGRGEAHGFIGDGRIALGVASLSPATPDSGVFHG